MLIRQAKLLHLHGEKLLEDAKNPKNTSLAMQCLRESRDIIQQLQSNSVGLFFEFAAVLNLELDYSIYVDFCMRNSLQVMSQQDFDGVVHETIQSLSQAKIER